MLNKPSSVPRSGDNHLSSIAVTCNIKRHNPEGSAGRFIPSLLGLAPDGVYLASLLPDCWCALTAPFHPCLCKQAVYISVALSLRSPSPGVIRHPALWSSDFPRLIKISRDYLSHSLPDHNTNSVQKQPWCAKNFCFTSILLHLCLFSVMRYTLYNLSKQFTLPIPSWD